MIQRLAVSPIYLRIATAFQVDKQTRKRFEDEIGSGSIKIVAEKESKFSIYAYGDNVTGEEHIAIVKSIDNGLDVPVRVHSSCITAEVFHASNCDCREQLDTALELIEKEGRGAVLWLHQEGRGNGLAAKIKQLDIMLSDGLDTVSAFEKAGYPADRRDYSVAADILRDLGIRSIRLITNNPDKLKQLSELGIEVTGRIPCEISPANEVVKKDLKARKEKLGHFLKGI